MQMNILELAMCRLEASPVVLTVTVRMPRLARMVSIYDHKPGKTEGASNGAR
jgi:hypothetical protein